MAQTDTKKVLDVRGAAEYLMVAPITIKRMAKRGLIGRKLGKVWRFRVEDLERCITNDVAANAALRGVGNEQVPAGNS